MFSVSVMQSKCKLLLYPLCRKYVQMHIEGSTEAKFALTDAVLTIDNADVEVIPLNRTDRHLVSLD